MVHGIRHLEPYAAWDRAGKIFREVEGPSAGQVATIGQCRIFEPRASDPTRRERFRGFSVKLCCIYCRSLQRGVRTGVIYCIGLDRYAGIHGARSCNHLPHLDHVQIALNAGRCCRTKSHVPSYSLSFLWWLDTFVPSSLKHVLSSITQSQTVTMVSWLLVLSSVLAGGHAAATPKPNGSCKCVSICDAPLVANDGF